jgi:hypothetical protein
MTEGMDEEERQFWVAQHLCNAYLPEYKWNMEQGEKIDKATTDVKAGKWPEDVAAWDIYMNHVLRPSLTDVVRNANAAIDTLKQMVEETQRCRARENKALRKHSDYTEGLAKKAEAEVAALKAEVELLAGTPSAHP